MNRKQFLSKLLEKTQQGIDFYKNPLNRPLEQQMPKASLKKYQVLQLGSCQIGKPTQPIFQNSMLIKSKQNCRKFIHIERTKSANKKQNFSHDPSVDKITKEIQNIIEREKKAQYCSQIRQSNTSQIAKVKQEENNDHNGIKFISKRSLTLSDSVETSRVQYQNKIESKKRQIYTQSNMHFHRHYSAKKSNNKKQSNHTQQVIKDPKKKQNQIFLMLRKQQFKTYAKPYTPPPKISAKAYIVYEKAQEQEESSSIKIHASLNSKNSLEVASLTKIMTCILAIKLCERFSLSMKEEFIKIGKFQSNIGGTSAKILPGDIYTLQDMLYGLMLPSGNDASLAIAVWGGRKLLQQQTKNQILYGERKLMKKECYERFIREMNTQARQLKLTKTNYANSHGLVNTLNRSCAHDIAHLSHHAMENSKFREIVSTKQYKKIIKTEIQVHNSSNDSSDNQDLETQSIQKKRNYPLEFVSGQRQVLWQNTHRLLWKKSSEYLGIKTGVTSAAGPCLSSLIRSYEGREFFIVVLNCKKMLSRFKQTEKLKKWVFKKEGIKLKNKNRRSAIIEQNLSDSESKEEEELIQ